MPIISVRDNENNRWRWKKKNKDKKKQKSGASEIERAKWFCCAFKVLFN